MRAATSGRCFVAARRCLRRQTTVVSSRCFTVAPGVVSDGLARVSPGWGTYYRRGASVANNLAPWDWMVSVLCDSIL